MRIVTTREGARVIHGEHVLSEMNAEPGPTHSIFDVLAAAVALTCPHPPLAVLGFAGGGMVAPLRALACDLSVDAVDLSLAAVPTFRRLSRAWSGQVQVTRADAVTWLRAQRRRFGCVVEDLSQQLPGDVVKPEVSFTVLPSLIRQRLAADGVLVLNVLPCANESRRSTGERLTPGYPNVRRIQLDDFQNEVVVAGARLPSAAALSRQLRLALWTLGSNQAERLSVRTLR